jgi:sugar transferase EpsL
VWYVEHHSLALDLRILARTLGSVLRAEGIAQEGHVTTDRFSGTRK